ncbi:hypothetical protein CBF34_04565 [Vagococcus penaei]|uniref:Uncharacterized protein n=1 Tax=Vagococcus penaei TaxID=633807 RepID=A0A1Q2D4J7_9ENTE|nr:hypothetical protein [Vagococcus penaei]AQP53302.1 hypothetical protein BW732_02990 [Vagococcus penaei]RSU04072.1 hypothetical protein CBF34_04565 [Vagococcus penaei]
MKVQLKMMLLLLVAATLLGGCSTAKKLTAKEEPTKPNEALMYTLDFDEHQYRFRLLNGWIKFPDKDSKIAFLVANKDKKSFMTAGFEPVEKQSLEDYQKEFVKKLLASQGKITVEPVKRELNDLPAFYLGFTLKDAKDRTLTYRTYLIQTDDYFINLAAWTSDSEPSKELLEELDTMLGTFEQLN